jgi:hypothetical protein
MPLAAIVMIPDSPYDGPAAPRVRTVPEHAHTVNGGSAIGLAGRSWSS